MDDRRRARAGNRPRLRLAPSIYAQTDLVCSVTICTSQGLPAFADTQHGLAAVSVLRELAESSGVQVFGYCVMPDHVHLVMSRSPTCDLIAFMGRYKNLVQRRAWSLGVQGTTWLRRCWDHFLRREEDVKSVVEYVWGGPHCLDSQGRV